MSEPRSVLERELERLSPPRIPLDQLTRRRDRKRRAQRIRAGAVGLAIGIGVALLGFNVIRSTPLVPTDDTRLPTPSPTEPAPVVRVDWESVPGTSIEGEAIVDIQTGEVTPLPASIASFRDATGYAVAPGGEALLFEASAGGSKRHQIFVANVDGTALRQLTDAPGRGATAGGWSPDGSKIVAVLDGDAERGDFDLVLIDVATSETTVLTSGPWGDFNSPHFSSDGQLILVSRFQKYHELEAPYPQDEGSDVYGIPVGGGEAALVFEDRWNATVSPDGRTMAYTRFISKGNVGGPELWLADADGSDPRPVTADEPFSDNPSWSPDGTRLVYSRLLLGEGDGVVVFDMASGTPTFFVRGGAGGIWLDDDTLLIDA
jgi:dipeptidyl aminopeptidase/acylaminoacyl peptidase